MAIKDRPIEQTASKNVPPHHQIPAFNKPFDSQAPTDQQGLIAAYINLALTPNVGPKTIEALAAQDIQANDIYGFNKEQLIQLKLDKKSIDHIIKHPPTNPCSDVERALNWSQQPSNHLITPLDYLYPERLRRIATPPPILMVRGELECLGLPQIAIVGSRYPSSQGQSQAFEFAKRLSELGYVITSGLARGIDAYAHKGALHGMGKTVAVLGTGLDEIYPKQNRRLADEIAENGAVVSEFPLRAKALPGHFPRRNRIVSGLSMGTLVVEATLKSGSLITARQALEQNREVFAIPGPINNPQKEGCHYLIRQGACLIETPDQITQELSFIHESMILNPIGQGASSETANLAGQDVNESQDLEQLQPEQYAILKAVEYEGVNLDALVAKTHKSVSELSIHLMELELASLIRQEQGLYFRC